MLPVIHSKMNSLICLSYEIIILPFLVLAWHTAVRKIKSVVVVCSLVREKKKEKISGNFLHYVREEQVLLVCVNAKDTDNFLGFVTV